MKTLMLILACVSLSIIAPFSIFPAVIYYVSEDGSDSNNGLSEQTPWQTVIKVNSMMSSYLPGDRILFKRGDKFIGTVNLTKSGVPGNEITFGAYGTGSQPLITGKKLITGWTVYSGNIYMANFADTVSQLYVDGKIMTIARYPNTGFLKIDAGNGSSGFSDAALTQPSGYFNNANCKLRSVNWKYEVRKVSNYSSGNVTLSSATLYPPAANYGYYFDNKLNLLDSQNEWFQDLSAGIIYLYTTSVSPVPQLVEGVTLNNGFYNTTTNYVEIRDIDISGFRQQGIFINSGNKISISRCTISGTGKYAIALNGTNHLIDSNVMYDNLNVGITGVLNGGIVSNNLVKRTGLIPGYGQAPVDYRGMQIHTSVGCLVEHNTIDSTGYSGLVAGQNMNVRKNIISNSCLTLNDGSNIDIALSDGLQITNNFLTNCIGNVESSSSPVQYAHGISFSPSSTKNVLIQGNTIASNRYDGIYVDNKNATDNNKILDNILYNNFRTQISFTDFSAQSFSPTYNTIVKGNIFYSLSWKQQCMEQQMFNSTVFSDFGNFDSNFYCNPYYEFMIRRTIVQPYSSKLYRFQKWQNISGEDLSSQFSDFHFEQYRVADSLSANLITNSRFTNNITGWNSWPAGSTIAHTVHPLLDTGSMRIRWNGIGHIESYTSSNTWAATKGDFFLTGMSIVGNTTGEFNSGTSINIPGYPDYNFKKFFVYENYRKNISYIFRVDTTDPAVRLSLGLIIPDSLLYVDNIFLHKVSVERIDSTEMSKLFSNQSDVTQNFSLGGLTYKDLDGTLVTGSISVPPYSSRILILDKLANVEMLSLKFYLEGFYDTSSNNMIPDSAMIVLRKSVTPYLIIDSAKTIFDSQGNSFLTFTKANYNEQYYIVINHRNSIETWSSTTIQFDQGASSASYDFTTAVTKAYGNNLKQIDFSPVNYGVYGGDVNKDGTIDAADIVLVHNDLIDFASGYLDTDVTGDNFVDASDLILTFNNSNNFISLIRP